MQNKRGIAQAFSTVPETAMLRRATVFDVFSLSRVLIRSITDLCAADHGNDPRNLRLWTANKDPETIRGWIVSGSVIWLAETAGQVAAVGGIFETGKVSLLYVDPDHAGRGMGSKLLAKLERELTAVGCEEARLDATLTARDFYSKQGWIQCGDPGSWNGIPQFRMRKSLHPVV